MKPIIVSGLVDADREAKGVRRTVDRMVARPTDVLYQIEPTTKLESVTLVNWKLFKSVRGPDQLETWKRDAKVYWATVPENSQELLIGVSVKILKRL